MNIFTLFCRESIPGTYMLILTNHFRAFDLTKIIMLWHLLFCADYYAPVKLVGGSSDTEGTVQIYHNGTWGTVCDDGWDDHDAKVVCRQLGFTDTYIRAVSNAHFGVGSGPIMLDNVRCYGHESGLSSCRFDGWYHHGCSHYEDAGVICGKKK